MGPTLALVALLSGGSSAQDAIDTMLRADYSCAASEAIQVDVPTLQKEPDIYIDRCVRVVGYVAGHWFVNDLSEIRGQSVEALAIAAPKFIGQGLQADPYPKYESRVELLGRFRSCGDRYRLFEARADEAMTQAGDERPRPPIMLAGVCHYVGYAVFSKTWHYVP
jgi:hypothetical protein